MLNYAKVVVMLKKEFPDITSEEIDEMISQIPSNTPTPIVKSLIKLTKICHKDPEKFQMLKNTSVQDVLESSIPSQDASARATKGE